MVLSPKCDRAFGVLSDERLSRRVRTCERASEFGFALLLLFVQIEAMLKILRYWQMAKNGWPDRLDFLTANWAPLRDLKASNPADYAVLIGSSGRSLREIRNRVAHEGHCFQHNEYVALASAARWALTELRVRMPARHELRAKVARVRKRPVKAKAL